jgi:hypothetical protein
MDRFLATTLCSHPSMMDGGQRLAVPNTYAALSAMTDEDWAAAPHRTEAASAAPKPTGRRDAYIRQRS